MGQLNSALTLLPFLIGTVKMDLLINLFNGFFSALCFKGSANLINFTLPLVSICTKTLTLTLLIPRASKLLGNLMLTLLSNFGSSSNSPSLKVF